MKILYPLIRTGGGADIYFENLSKEISKEKIQHQIKYYPQFFELMPFLLEKKFNSFDFNIIHSNAEYGFAFKQKSKPLIISAHHLVFVDYYKRYLSLQQRLFHKLLYKYMEKSFKSAEKVIAVSNYTKEEIKKIFGIEKVEVIYNGIDTELFKPSSGNYSNDNKIKLLFVGNPTRRKGFDLAKKIMERLDENFVLYYTSGLRVNEKSENNRIIPLGRLSLQELISWYNKCDIFLSPSRLEGFGYSIAEAMGCAKPIVATNISSIPELVDNNKGGFLCKIDDEKDFVEKIEILGDDENLRKNFGIYNRKKVLKDFDVSITGKKIIETYENLI